MTNVSVGESEAALPALFERAAGVPGQRQKLEAMRQLAGGIAHDFNNLLTPVIGGLNLIQRRLGGDEKTERLIAGAIEAAERAKLLAQRLLAFASRQPGEEGPDRMPGRSRSSSWTATRLPAPAPRRCWSTWGTGLYSFRRPAARSNI